MLQLIIEEIGDHAMKQRGIGEDCYGTAASQSDLQAFLRHGRFIEIDHHAQQFVQIDFAPRQPQRVRLSLGNIQRLVQKVSQPIEFVNGGDDGFGLLPLDVSSTATFQVFREWPSEGCADRGPASL